MSFAERLVAHLARQCRMTSTGEVAIPIQCVLNFPAGVGVPRRLTAKNLITKAEKLQLRQGEYGMGAIELALSVLDIQIDIVELTENISSRLTASCAIPAFQEQQPASSAEVPANMQVVEYTGAIEAQVVEADNPYRHLSQETLVSVLCDRDAEIKTLKVKLQKTQKQKWRLEQKLDATSEQVVALSKTKDDEKLAIVRKATHAERSHITGCATFALAIGRNFSSIATTDLGIVLLDTMSKDTVIRAEIKTAAAILGSTFSYWEHELQVANVDAERFGFSTTSITCDATGAGAWKKKKVSTCCIESSFLDSQDGYLQHIKRLCDTLPVDSGNTAATLGILLKHMQSIHCPSWRGVPSNSRFVRLFLYTSDRGPDQVGVRCFIKEETASIPNVLFFDADCCEHQLHLIIKDGLKAADCFLKASKKSYKYFSSLTKVVQLWRENAQAIKDKWAERYGDDSAAAHRNSLCPQCVAGRWESVDRVEERLESMGVSRLHGVMGVVLA